MLLSNIDQLLHFIKYASSVNQRQIRIHFCLKMLILFNKLISISLLWLMVRIITQAKKITSCFLVEAIIYCD